MLLSDGRGNATLSAHHASLQSPEFVDFLRDLRDGYGKFQTAQQINHSLIALYKLVAQGRMSPRQGAVLGNLGSLVLRSLTSIDYDNDRFPEEREEQTPHTASGAQTRKATRSPSAPRSALARSLCQPQRESSRRKP